MSLVLEDGKKIRLAGRDVRVAHRNIDIYQIEYDITNPRIGFFIDTTPDKLTQEAMPFALKKDKASYDSLKESIEINGGATYPIYVIEIAKNKYTVLEGNTRLLIYRDLHAKDPAKPDFRRIPSIVLPKDLTKKEEDFIRLIAHLRGPTEWDAYEKARYLYHLWDKEGYNFDNLKKNTKLSINEIKANIDAFELMERQYKPKYGKDRKYVQRFSYFVEYIKDKKLQALLQKNRLSVKDFCKWVAEEKVSRAIDVRDLKEFFQYPQVSKKFLKEDYDAAMYELSTLRPEFSSRLYEDVRRVIDDLKKIGLGEIIELSNKENDAKRKLLLDLQSLLEATLKNHFKRSK